MRPVPSPCQDCPRALELQLRVTDLQAELQAWRDQHAGDRKATATIVRCAEIKMRLGLSPSAARLLIDLIDHPGELRTNARLFAVTAGKEDRGPEVTAVHLCRVRSALRRAGFEGAIQTVWGQGYRVSRSVGEQLKAWLAEADGDELEARRA